MGSRNKKKHKVTNENPLVKQMLETDNKETVDTKTGESKVGDTSDLIKQLMDAAKSGDVTLVENLITNQNVDVNSTSRTGKTALHYASDYKNTGVIKVLLNLGADTTIQDTIAGMTPLMISINRGNKEAVNALLEYDNGCYKISTYSNVSPLNAAAYNIGLHEDWEMVEILLKQHQKLYPERNTKLAQKIEHAFYHAVEMENEIYSHGNKYVELVEELGLSDLLLDN